MKTETKDKFLIKGLGGKKKLKGKIAVNGAKNAVLPALASSILFKDKLCISNVPDIKDVENINALLQKLGADVKKAEKKKYCITANKIKLTSLDRDISKKMRGSIVLSGPLLARFGKVSFPHPGGCVIGARPIDAFLDGFKKMGAKVKKEKEFYNISIGKNKKLKGADIFLNKMSVTVTETLILAGVLAKGKTVIGNAAMEPEIKDIADFLNSCGAKIKGAGTSTVEITGGDLLKAGKKVYKTLPDRIEAGSFLILGALAGDDLEITNCNPGHIKILINMLKDSGVPIIERKNKIIIKRNGRMKNKNFKCVDIKTHEYPGFPTDLQSPMAVYLTQISGENLLFETIFEGRLNYTSDLVKMGADITMWDPHRIMIKGPTLLRGKELVGPDLRAEFAFFMAAIIAKGESVINNVQYIGRGYERIEERLRGIGVDIKRVKN
ncbi:MAG: UDP-N-acetylglucosamine 1-carboxyvinyltransferase [Candidatus Pacebacteria bacterium]|jgi:UDP-N-acetylglucosamine 1-carboxyvinyltransferase|nr:UDP-N-acetylglucosamine 1-carboxyvinyltransferase [Candidatus Paceibacterota bacterium]|tara:strand:- start:6281 stop:7594 length:1314 start_codon:yes stop_codon:yes gene_type:complete